MWLTHCTHTSFNDLLIVAFFSSFWWETLCSLWYKYIVVNVHQPRMPGLWLKFPLGPHMVKMYALTVLCIRAFSKQQSLCCFKHSQTTQASINAVPCYSCVPCCEQHCIMFYWITAFYDYFSSEWFPFTGGLGKLGPDCNSSLITSA